MLCPPPARHPHVWLALTFLVFSLKLQTSDMSLLVPLGSYNQPPFQMSKASNAECRMTLKFDDKVIVCKECW